MSLGMLKKRKILFVALIALAGCQGGEDCRQKTMECAEGFSCEEGAGGSWECAKEKLPEAAPAREIERPHPHPNSHPNPEEPRVAKPEPGRPAGPVPCMKHPMCGPMATECICNRAGKIISRSLDRDRDGRADEKATYAHDDEGHLAEVTVDVGLDGKVDSKHRYEYDVRGNPLLWEIRRMEGSVVTADEQRITYVYNDEGKLTEENVDTKLDGTVDRKCTFDPPCPPPIPNRECKPVCK